MSGKLILGVASRGLPRRVVGSRGTGDSAAGQAYRDGSPMANATTLRQPNPCRRTP